MCFVKQLCERLPAFRLRHAFELDKQPAFRPAGQAEACPHLVGGRDDHLDVGRQLRREPGYFPRRVGGGQLIESVDEENQRLLRGRHRQPFLERILEFRVIDRRLVWRDLFAKAGKERVAARRFGRRADEAPDHPARTCVLLRGLRHHRGLARARFAVQDQRPTLRPAEVICNCVQHRLAPGEDAAAFFGEAVVRFHFQIQRRTVFEALHLCLDHLFELGEDGTTQRGRVAGRELRDIAGQAVAQIRLQFLQPRIALPGWPSQETENVLPVRFGLAQPRQDLLMRRRGFVLDEISFRQSGSPRGLRQRLMQCLLHRIPSRRGGELARPRLQTAFRRDGIFVQPVPSLSLRPRVACRDVRQKRGEFRSGDSGRQWLPAVPVAEQHDEVRPDSGCLAAPDLAQADLHRLLVERGLVADAPTEVDGLEPRAMLLAQRAQLRKHVALKRVALGLQILKRRADEDAKGAGCDRHQTISNEGVVPAHEPATGSSQRIPGSVIGRTPAPSHAS